MLIIEIDKQNLRNAFKKKSYEIKSVSKDCKGENPDSKIIFEIIFDTLKEECK